MVRKLIGFTDTRGVAQGRKKVFSKLGYKKITIRKKFGGYEVTGLKSKKK